jgi:ubiquinone/menaquinone biosynthesis C-methylase UbiE
MSAQEQRPSAQAWDDAAIGWHGNTPLIHDWLHGATRALLDAAHLTAGAKVLDVAAGAGDQTRDIAQRVGEPGEVWVTDVSPRIMALARDQLRAAGGARLHFQVADAQTLGLAGADFDAAVCRLGLMFCAAPLEALRRMHAALRPGGRVAALVFSTPQANPCVAITLRAARRHAGLADADPYAAGSLLSLGRPGLAAQVLADAGFSEIEVMPLAAPFRLPSARDYVDFVRSSGSPVIELLRRLSAARQADAWADIERQLNCFTTENGWEGPNELLLCSATRLSAPTRPSGTRAPIADARSRSC